MITLTDDAGRLLAAFSTCDTQGNVITVRSLSFGSGDLLRYFFIEGGRSVTLHAGGLLLQGQLQTAWDYPGRRWEIRLVPADSPLARHQSAPREAYTVSFRESA